MWAAKSLGPVISINLRLGHAISTSLADSQILPAVLIVSDARIVGQERPSVGEPTDVEPAAYKRRRTEGLGTRFDSPHSSSSVGTKCPKRSTRQSYSRCQRAVNQTM